MQWMWCTRMWKSDGEDSDAVKAKLAQVQRRQRSDVEETVPSKLVQALKAVHWASALMPWEEYVVGLRSSLTVAVIDAEAVLEAVELHVEHCHPVELALMISTVALTALLGRQVILCMEVPLSKLQLLLL